MAGSAFRDPNNTHGATWGGFMDPVAEAGAKVDNMIHPERPFDAMSRGMEKAAKDAQALADLQWQRQMQGLTQALGFMNHSQGAWNSVYGAPMPAPGATLPDGLMNQRGGQPMMAPPGNQTAPGLAGYFGRTR